MTCQTRSCATAKVPIGDRARDLPDLHSAVRAETRWVWVSARRTVEIRSGGRRLGIGLLISTLLAFAMVAVLTLQLFGWDRWMGWGVAFVAGLVYVAVPADLVARRVGKLAEQQLHVAQEQLLGRRRQRVRGTCRQYQRRRCPRHQEPARGIAAISARGIGASSVALTDLTTYPLIASTRAPR